MWIYLKRGLVSAVKHRHLPDHFLVRSRVKRHLENFLIPLTESEWDGGDAPEIEETPENDYPYRATVPRRDFGNLVRYHALAVDYGNFKEAVYREEGKAVSLTPGSYGDATTGAYLAATHLVDHPGLKPGEKPPSPPLIVFPNARDYQDRLAREEHLAALERTRKANERLALDGAVALAVESLPEEERRGWERKALAETDREEATAFNARDREEDDEA